MRRQNGIILLSILVSGVLTFLIMRDVPLHEVGESLQSAHRGWILVSIIPLTLALWTRAVRWRGLLNNQISVRDSFYILGITMMLNQLPLRAGEVVRSYLVTREGVPFMTAATSIVFERLLDVLLVVLLIAGALTQVPDAPPELARGAILLGTLGVIGFILLLFLANYPQITHRVVQTLLRTIPLLGKTPLERWVEQMTTGLYPLTNRRMLGHAILWTILSWLSSLLILYTLILALDIPTKPLLATVLGISLTSLSIAIPVSVASLGLFEAAILLAGEIVGMETVSATALGFLFHGITVLSYVVVGIIGMFALGLSTGDVFQNKP